ncbi:MAG: NAD(P)-dependent oxidoreductase [Acetobacteraceae bacterium]|jgi:NADH dehydrogenase
MARQTFTGGDRHLILTGADGYIGSQLVARARAQGWSITVLSRRPEGPQDQVRKVPWVLGAPLPPTALHPTVPAARQVLVHLAHDWSDTKPGPAEGTLNLEGTRVLLDACRAAGLGRFVFVSSQSARADAANVYGRVKWRIEQLLQGDSEVSARVGLVYGGPPRAMFGLLSKLTARLPVLPMIDPWREVQPIHLDEVCEGLLRLAAGTGGGWSGLAGPSGLPFGTFLRSLAQELHGRRLRILPIPLRFALLACDILGRLPVGPKPDRERILGLAGTRPMNCEAHLRALDLTVAPLTEQLRREPASRRAMLAEGRALLAYVLRSRPGRPLLARYVRAVDGAGPLPLSGLLRRVPRLLRLVEPRTAGAPLAQRLALAMALAEASPEGERALTKGSRATSLAILAYDVALDVVLLPLRIATAGRVGRGH